MREAILAHPDAVRAIREEFVPVSVPLPLLIEPAGRDVESRLFSALYQARIGAQGLCVASPDGRRAIWLPLPEDAADFLVHARAAAADLARGRGAPAAPIGAAPGAVIGDIPDAHGAGEPCPLAPPPPDGAMVVDLIGRALDPDGRPTADLATQLGYVEQTVALPAALGAALDAACAGASPAAPAPAEIELPVEFARWVLAHAYLGPEDSRPWRNALALTCAVPQLTFRAAPAPDAPGRWRLVGATAVRTTGLSPDPGRPGFATAIDLAWEGALELGPGPGARRLVLLGEGTYSLRSPGCAPEPDASGRGRKPLGTPKIDLTTRVRFGIAAPGAGVLRPAPDFEGAASRAIRERMRRLAERVGRLRGSGIDLSPLLRILEQVEPLMWRGEREKVEQTLDRVIEALDRIDAARPARERR